VDAGDEDPLLSPIDHGSLRPYVSVLIVEGVGGDNRTTFSALAEKLRDPATRQTRSAVALAAEKLTPGAPIELMVELIALVHRVDLASSWYIGSDFVDHRHVFTVLVRADDLIAVLLDRSWADRMQSWLDDPENPVERVPNDVLRTAFLRGRTKGPWLRGQHASRATVPDSKAYSGQSLEWALNPHTEGSFGVTAGRAELVANGDRRVLLGEVGTTPTKGLVWCRRAASMRDFLDVLLGLFQEGRSICAGGRRATSSPRSPCPSTTPRRCTGRSTWGSPSSTTHPASTWTRTRPGGRGGHRERVIRDRRQRHDRVHALGSSRRRADREDDRCSRTTGTAMAAAPGPDR
jgi:hypothetical protein